MTSSRYYAWSQLVGCRVEVRRNRRPVRTGIVDDAMPDSSMLWLAADQNEDRALFDAAEGYELWSVPLGLPDAETITRSGGRARPQQATPLTDRKRNRWPRTAP
ncbi:hypothetical protein EYS21_13595 [Arthrobacter sp. S39]|nr:hypothetical protein EYS21_13595 [Arthrobacter sp. S39]